MRTTIMLMVMSVLGLAHASERPVLRGREAPRATALLRAETLADQAQKRLRVPTKRGQGWQKGGSGWGGRAKDPERETPVIIDVHPDRRARRD
jgi:hypothetical protein